jgi:hypothetical protein
LLVQKKSPRKHLNTSRFGERWFGAGMQTWSLDSASGHWRSGDVFGVLLRNNTSRWECTSVFVIPAKAGMTEEKVVS